MKKPPQQEVDLYGLLVASVRGIVAGIPRKPPGRALSLDGREVAPAPAKV